MKDKWINRVLTVVLILSIFVIGGATLIMNTRSLGYAALVNYKQYLRPGANAIDNVEARIKSLTSAINVNLVGKGRFEQLNARLQLALGKQWLSFGGAMMVRLKTGQLYDVAADSDVSDDVQSIAALDDKLTDMGIPLVYLYAHSELYEEGMLPQGVVDYNNKVADDIVFGLRDAGIETIDSRQVYKDRGLTLDEAVFRTDLHWSILTAFTMYGEAVKALNQTGAITLDEGATDIERFNLNVLEGAHMGDVGARVGEKSVEPDDFQMITPKYPTHIRQKISGTEDFERREGTFEEAVLNLEKLEGEVPLNRYDTYGLHRELTYYTNESAPEGRLLILKDSFGTPVSSFMSLAAREVCALDLRKGRTKVEDVIEQFKPDAVLVVYCQEMMRGKNYVFVE